MSASLVGSEMCIRDRLMGPRSASSGRLAQFCKSTMPRLPQCPERPRRDCLLYTSDAADDM
eukprot:10841183-Alexandrium_andersonii.AAC.1